MSTNRLPILSDHQVPTESDAATSLATVQVALPCESNVSSSSTSASSSSTSTSSSSTSASSSSTAVSWSSTKSVEYLLNFQHLQSVSLRKKLGKEARERLSKEGPRALLHLGLDSKEARILEEAKFARNRLHELLSADKKGRGILNRTSLSCFRVFLKNVWQENASTAFNPLDQELLDLYKISLEVSKNRVKKEEKLRRKRNQKVEVKRSRLTLADVIKGAILLRERKKRNKDLKDDLLQKELKQLKKTINESDLWSIELRLVLAECLLAVTVSDWRFYQLRDPEIGLDDQSLLDLDKKRDEEKQQDTVRESEIKIFQRLKAHGLLQKVEKGNNVWYVIPTRTGSVAGSIWSYVLTQYNAIYNNSLSIDSLRRSFSRVFLPVEPSKLLAAKIALINQSINILSLAFEESLSKEKSQYISKLLQSVVNEMTLFTSEHKETFLQVGGMPENIFRLAVSIKQETNIDEIVKLLQAQRFQLKALISWYEMFLSRCDKQNEAAAAPALTTTLESARQAAGTLWSSPQVAPSVPAPLAESAAPATLEDRQNRKPGTAFSINYLLG